MLVVVLIFLMPIAYNCLLLDEGKYLSMTYFFSGFQTVALRNISGPCEEALTMDCGGCIRGKPKGAATSL